MPTIEYSVHTFIVGSGETFVVDTIQLHNGVAGYNLENRKLILPQSSIPNPHQLAVLKRPGSTDIISAPKLNACQFVLIKSKKSPDLCAMAHIAPGDDLEANYRELFEKFPPNDELDVVFCVAQSGVTDLISKVAQEQSRKINSLREIPFKFRVETSVFRGEPKSVYFHYVPADDSLIIYSDSYALTKAPAAHMALNVFNEPLEPIIFHQLQAIGSNKVSETALSSAADFSKILPVLTNKFLTEHPKSRCFTYQSCPVELVPNIKGKPDIVGQKRLAITKGFDFIAENTVGLLKQAQEGSAAGAPVNKYPVEVPDDDQSTGFSP